MRWFVGVVGIVVVAALFYAGSALVSLRGLISAAQRADGAAIFEHTDINALKRSLAAQVVEAYLKRIGATRPIKPLERMAANTYGASIVDAQLAKFLTVENLTMILKSGAIPSIGENMPSSSIAPLSSLDTASITSLIGRVSLINPSEFAVRIGSEASNDEASNNRSASIRLHRTGLDWKLAGIYLPAKIIEQISATLPAR